MWIINLNVKPKTMKLVEENTKTYLPELEASKDFLHSSKKANSHNHKRKYW